MERTLENLYEYRFGIGQNGNINFCECGDFHHVACCFKGKDR